MMFLEQPLIMPFLCQESATTCQIDSNKVSNSKLKHGLRDCVKIDKIEFIPPPQHPHKLGTIFLDTLYNKSNRWQKYPQRKLAINETEFFHLFVHTFSDSCSMRHNMRSALCKPSFKVSSTISFEDVLLYTVLPS